MQVSTGFVLGAGLGTRLKTLTQNRPKPLIPVANRPLITYAFDHLIDAGISKLVINTHWRAEAYPKHFPENTYRDVPLHFRHEWPEVLETGGGIKNVADLLDNTSGAPFVVYNGDILTDLPLARALEAHKAQQNEVTMVLRSKDGPLQVAFDAKTHRVVDIGRRLRPEEPGQYLFTGVYVVNPGFLNRIPPGEKISVVPIFLDMIRSGAGLGALGALGTLGGVVLDEGSWWDLGTREQYLAVHEALAQRAGENRGPWIHPSAQVDSTANVGVSCAIGAGCIVGAGVVLENAILWENVRVEPGAHLSGCIVTSGAVVSGSHRDADL